ncbi:multidrug effflux MFS transporter [Agromyces sp. NPDC058484]|uniref:multidrug effflux MFS transporter n=1 Tax=Agromyces sp. NPDC058484 TaxID=3346524 RepID=UPI003648C6D3
MPTPRPLSLTPGLLAVLGVLAAVGPIAVDMYLASFTDIADELGADAASVQLTLTAFLIGMSAGQLLLGPLSDRWGRRPVLLAALVVFAASGTAMAFAPTIGVFIALRLVQGLSGAAGVVLARAIAVDLSTGATAVRALSLIATVVGVGPLIAPPIGGFVSSAWGWRAVLGVIAVASVVMLLLAWLRVPESLPPEKRHTGGLGATVRRFGTLLRDPGLALYTLAFGLGFAAMMSYISASPFVGQAVLGMSPIGYSFGFAAGAAALILANLLNARVAERVGPRRMLLVGVTLLVLAASALIVLSTTGTLTPAAFIACAFVTTGGTGLTMSNASALALARTTPSSRGAGSALLGASQFLLGGLASPVVGLWGEHTAVPMASVMLLTAVAAASCAVAARSRTCA